MEIFLEILSWIGYIIVAILCLMFMIIVHESGHFLAGKMLGFKIDEFSIGFGPHIFKRKSKKTGMTFAVRWLPLGGYCAFYGEEDEEDKAKKREEDKAKEELKQAENAIYGDMSAEAVVDNAVVEGEKCSAVTEETEPKAIPFNDQAPWKRIIVFIAGALFNYISAILIISIFFMAYGEYTPTVGHVYDIGTNIEQKFETGDEILKVNGKWLYTSININDLSKHLSNAGDSATVTIRRDGEVMDIEVKKGVFTPVDLDGNVIIDETTGAPMVKEGFGINIESYGRYKFGFFEAIGRAFVFSFKVVGMIFSIFGQLFTGAIGIKGNLGGPVTTITMIASLTRVGFDAILYAICTMSATLAVMNLLPLPALDGSKVVFTLIEWVRGKPINRKVENMIHLVGLFLLFGMTIVFDIINFI